MIMSIQEWLATPISMEAGVFMFILITAFVLGVVSVGIYVAVAFKFRK